MELISAIKQAYLNDSIVVVDSLNKFQTLLEHLPFKIQYKESNKKIDLLVINYSYFIIVIQRLNYFLKVENEKKEPLKL